MVFVAAVIGINALLNLNSASAFSTYYANPSINIHHAAAHGRDYYYGRQRYSQSSQSSRFRLDGRSSPRLTSSSSSSSSGGLLTLNALADDDVDDSVDDGSDDSGGDGERTRKRDILKRTLGLGGSSSSDSDSGAGGESGERVVKLNTDNLFKGMPSVDSILGSTPPISSISPLSDSSSSSGISSAGENSDGFQKQGKKEYDLLTPEDMAILDSKYDTFKYESEQLVSDELSKGSDGKLAKDGNDDIIVSKDESTGGALNITQEEAKKIVDYAVAEEKASEKRQMNTLKKEQLIQSWENEGKAQEDLIESNMASSQDGGEDILQKDGVAREIIDKAQERETNDSEREKGRRELDFYERQILQRQQIEGTIEKATSELKLEEEGGGAYDLDDAYEQALDSIQSSRKEKLGRKSLGVFANSIALEEGREFLRSQKARKEFREDVEKEISMANDKQGSEFFFEEPVNYEEERMYRSIVRQIVNKREPDDDIAESTMSEGEEVDEDCIPILPQYRDAKAKYQLTPKETVEAYKLLNLWREIQSEQDTMEKALGMKDDDSSTTIASRRPLNKLEPFFLYEEDSEEKRQKERDNLAKVLQKGLESDDEVEASSSDLLMKELMEGGVTKDRAIRLLDKLMNKAESGSTIMSSLEELKKTIMEEDDDSEPETLLFRKTKTGGPVDLSGVFRTSDMEEEEDGEEIEIKASLPPKPMESTGGGAAGRTMPSWMEEEKENKSPPAPLTPPNTPFFSSPEETSSTSTDNIKEPPPPSTPFFQSEEEDVSSALGDGKPTGGMFGTYEEQRLQKLATKVGAQTEQEMDELKRNMEALKEAEEMANAQLSDAEFDIETATAKLGIDVDSLNLDVDDDDQIMSIIGKRPVGGGTPASSTGQKKAILKFDESESDDIIVDATGQLKKMEKYDAQKKPDIADDIFRAKTAGKYTDKETRDADEAAYRDFMKMEEEAEKRLDSVSNESFMREDIDDIDEYADDIMSEMKPRPPVRGRREDFMSQEELQKERRKESIFGDDDPFPTRDDSEPQQQTSYSGDGAMPEWFRKEQETLGIKMEDLDDDELEEARGEWEREERQRKADEYLKKKGEGISISDVLGREYFGPMDEPDDMYDKTRSTFDSFEARKELLLSYTELTVEDINNVVDFKVDPLSTGYNRYLSKVQRPFSEYGAIFRLEGVLSDTVGLHAKAWKIVSEKTGYRIDSGDEVKQASLYKPEEAVREVFRWTDDIFELKDIAEIHQTAFQEAFDEWFESGCHVVMASDEVLADGADYSSSNNVGTKATPSDEEMYSMYYLAWSKLANNMDKSAPTSDEVQQGVLGGDWEVAVRDIFGWSQDPNEVYDIVVAYDEILQADYKILLHKYGIDLDKMNAEEEESQFGLVFPDVSLKEGVKEWLDTLHEVDMPFAVVTHLNSYQLDTVLNVTGLAEYFPSEKRVSSDSCYSSERSELLGATLRLEQRPDKCVIFDNTPKSAKEAHEVTMKSVSLVDHYARYELLTADLSVGYARDLDLISFTKLFDERTDLDLEPVLELDVSSGLQKQQRQIKTAFWDE